MHVYLSQTNMYTHMYTPHIHGHIHRNLVRYTCTDSPYISKHPLQLAWDSISGQ